MKTRYSNQINKKINRNYWSLFHFTFFSLVIIVFWSGSYQKQGFCIVYVAFLAKHSSFFLNSFSCKPCTFSVGMIAHKTCRRRNPSFSHSCNIFRTQPIKSCHFDGFLRRFAPDTLYRMTEISVIPHRINVYLKYFKSWISQWRMQHVFTLNATTINSKSEAFAFCIWEFLLYKKYLNICYKIWSLINCK